jgi:hypothetical protein
VGSEAFGEAERREHADGRAERHQDGLHRRA